MCVERVRDSVYFTRFYGSQRVNVCKELLNRVSNDNLCEEIGTRLDREYEIKGAFECAKALSCA